MKNMGVKTFLKNNALSVAVFIAWITYMAINSRWEVYKSGWPLALTMVGGAFVAGSTPMGSGAIAYPVLVLVIKFASNDARTFSMMIQSVGMSCASYRIFMLKYETLCAKSLLYMVSVGMVGFNIGFYLIRLPSMYVQTLYFTITLILGVFVQSYINFAASKKRSISGNDTMTIVPLLSIEPKHLWVFIPTTLIGGILVSMVGTGIDVFVYIFARLAMNTDEHVTTNHTVILMAFMSLFGFYNALVIQPFSIPQQVWDYWLCSVPVVLYFAPFGNYVTNKWLKKESLNKYIYVLETFQYIAGFIITISKYSGTIILSMSMLGTAFAALLTMYRNDMQGIRHANTEKVIQIVN